MKRMGFFFLKSRGGEHAKTRDEKNLDSGDSAHNTGLAIYSKIFLRHLGHHNFSL